MPLQAMQPLTNFEGKSYWLPKGSTLRSEIPLLAMQLSSNYKVISSTKEQYMKESNIIASNAAIKQARSELK